MSAVTNQIYRKYIITYLNARLTIIILISRLFAPEINGSNIVSEVVTQPPTHGNHGPRAMVHLTGSAGTKPVIQNIYQKHQQSLYQCGYREFLL